MRLTTKGRYAVTAMLDLALHASRGPVSLNDISGRQGISLSYLEQLFAKLRRSGLVTTALEPIRASLPTVIGPRTLAPAPTTTPSSKVG